MVKAEELRIGNILKDKLTGSLLRVDELTIERKIVTYVIDRSKYPLPKGWQITPVEISEEILLKCGFEGRWYAGEDFISSHLKLDKCQYMLAHKQFRIDHFIIRDIQYLHQIQNIFYCLCGKELDTSNFI